MIKLKPLYEIRLQPTLRKVFDSIKEGDVIEYKLSMENGRISRMRVDKKNEWQENNSYYKGIRGTIINNGGEFVSFFFNVSPDDEKNKEAITVRKVNKIDEIKILPGITPEMVTNLYFKLFDKNSNREWEGNLRNIRSKYGLKGMYRNVNDNYELKKFPQNKLNEFYKELKKIENDKT